jgi:cell division protein FtsL
MIRLNLVLLVAVMVSAFYLVHTQYESRSLYTELDRAHAQTRKLDVEHEQLQVLKREQAASARVQMLASRQLKMHPVTPGITQYVTMSGAAPVTSTVQEQRP